MPKIKPGELYRHYKGGLYRVIGVALETDGTKEFVIYREADFEGVIRGEHSCDFWAREKWKWFDIVTVGEPGNREVRHRFEKVEV